MRLRTIKRGEWWRAFTRAMSIITFHGLLLHWPIICFIIDAWRTYRNSVTKTFFNTQETRQRSNIDASLEAFALPFRIILSNTDIQGDNFILRRIQFWPPEHFTWSYSECSLYGYLYLVACVRRNTIIPTGNQTILNVVEVLNARPFCLSWDWRNGQAACHDGHVLRRFSCIDELWTCYAIIFFVDKATNICFCYCCHSVARSLPRLRIGKIKSANEDTGKFIDLLYCEKRIGSFVAAGIVSTNIAVGKIMITELHFVENLQ